MKKFLTKYKHAWILSYFIIYLIWFFYLEARTNVKFTDIHIKLDDFIPFQELFIIPYLLWFFYIAVVILYFFFTNKTDYFKCCSFLFLGMTISLIIYTFWPNAQNLRPDTFARDNIFVDWVKQLYKSDTSTNVCPSIHVFNSIGVHLSIIKSEQLKKYKIIRIGSFFLATSICLATVFLKQHSAFDGICAIGLAYVTYILVYRINYSALFLKEKKKESSCSFLE